MKRTYLEEDLDLIRKYFPGAKAVTLRTPFDLTHTPRHLPQLATNSLHTTGSANTSWMRDILWTN